jgi:excisionase family DNA binding protein
MFQSMAKVFEMRRTTGSLARNGMPGVLVVLVKSLRGAVKKDRGTFAEVLTVDELSAYLRIHRSTLYRLIKTRQIPFFRIGSDYRFNRQAVADWSRAQEGQPAPPAPSSRPRGRQRRT